MTHPLVPAAIAREVDRQCRVELRATLAQGHADACALIEAVDAPWLYREVTDG